MAVRAGILVGVEPEPGPWELSTGWVVTFVVASIAGILVLIAGEIFQVPFLTPVGVGLVVAGLLAFLIDAWLVARKTSQTWLQAMWAMVKRAFRFILEIGV